MPQDASSGTVRDTRGLSGTIFPCTPRAKFRAKKETKQKSVFLGNYDPLSSDWIGYRSTIVMNLNKTVCQDFNFAKIYWEESEW